MCGREAVGILKASAAFLDLGEADGRIKVLLLLGRDLFGFALEKLAPAADRLGRLARIFLKDLAIRLARAALTVVPILAVDMPCEAFGESFGQSRAAAPIASVSSATTFRFTSGSTAARKAVRWSSDHSCPSTVAPSIRTSQRS